MLKKVGRRRERWGKKGKKNLHEEEKWQTKDDEEEGNQDHKEE